ncbi:MAG: potassium channel family protein [Candidatus Nanoarchaeia archaeon]|nr:potassium channel family protein [Candidatus Nanoarchaeia archaeon]
MNFNTKLKHVLREIRKRGTRIWVDKLNYFSILVIWTLVIVLFGCIYYFAQDSESYLVYSIKQTPVDSLQDSIYFSFVAATTTGFGDIIPNGSFKIIAIFEVIFGLILIATVASKLVSIKQDAILGELYELSIKERVHKTRSSLLLFRQNLDRMIDKLEEGPLHKREISNIPIYISSLKDTLHETTALITKKEDHQLIKGVDSINTELIFNSILNSFEKFHELTSSMNQNKLEWKNNVITSLMNDCIVINKNLISKLATSKALTNQTIADLNSRENEIATKLNETLGIKQN